MEVVFYSFNRYNFCFFNYQVDRFKAKPKYAVFFCLESFNSK